MRAGHSQPGQLTTSALSVSVAKRVLESLRKSFGDEIGAAPPVILCSSPGRFYLRRILEPFLPKISVISPLEIPPVTPVRTVGVVN